MTKHMNCMPMASTLAAVLIAVLLAVPVMATTNDTVGPLQETLDQLSEILQHLEGQLSALEGPRAERLEEGLEQMIELIESLLDEFDRPRERDSERAFKARILKLDKSLHQLVSILEGIVDGAEPDQSDIRDAIGELHSWVDGTIAVLAAGLAPDAADRLETAAHTMVRELALRIADMADKARSEQSEHPRLELVLNRLKEVVHRLDLIIRRWFLTS